MLQTTVAYVTTAVGTSDATDATSPSVTHDSSHVATQENIKSLAERINDVPETQVTVDVMNSEVCAGDLKFSVEIPEGAREALTNGRWDPIAELQEAEDSIDNLVTELGYLRRGR